MTSSKTLKSSKKVQFNIPKPLEVVFELTDSTSSYHNIHFPFTTQTTNATKINTLFDAIHAIRALTLTLDSLDENNLRTLRENLGILLQLDCISQGTKSEFKKRVYLFFDRMIAHAPLNNTTLGQPGSDHYIEKLTELNSKIKRINHILNILNIRKISLKLSLFTPENIKVPFYISNSDLPSSALDFQHSLDVSAVENIHRWTTHFKTLYPAQLQDYLAKMLGLIERLENDSTRQMILTQLKTFITHFESTCYGHQAALFSEMLHMGEQSPFRNHPAEYQQLTTQLETLLTPSATFNADFLHFRQALTQAINQPHIHNEKLLHTLLHFQLNHPHDKNTPQAKIIETYISRCLARISTPLPEALQSTFDDLLATYHPSIPNTHAPHKNTYKAMYLEQLMNIIQTSPEKTYLECVRITLENGNIPNQIEPSIHHALDRPNTQSQAFFCQTKHRFTDFISTLIAAEPNYEMMTSTVSCANTSHI